MLSDPLLVTPELIDLGVHQVRQTRFQSRPISRSIDLRERLVGIQAPRFILLGERDPHQRSQLAVRVPQYRAILGEDNVSVLPGAHWLQYDCPGAFEAAIRSIAQALEPAPPAPERVFRQEAGR
jgi:pimeloyl-ACP methyl ester carboxylesterase